MVTDRQNPIQTGGIRTDITDITQIHKEKRTKKEITGCCCGWS